MNDKKHWLDEPRNVQRLWRVFLGLLALTIAAEFFVPLEAHFEVESWFAFAAWYGFGTCILMIVGAKCLSFLLRRPDSYYAGNAGDATDHAHRDD